MFNMPWQAVWNVHFLILQHLSITEQSYLWNKRNIYVEHLFWSYALVSKILKGKCLSLGKSTC